MTHKLLILIICVPALVSCSEPKREEKISLRDSWYKHYTGTIAGKQVHVNLHCSNREVVGFYSYDEHKIPIALYDEDKNSATKEGNTLNLTEQAITEQEDGGENSPGAHWMIDVAAHKITGKWISNDGVNTYDIDLEERYPKGAIQFDILRMDTASGTGATTILSADVVAFPTFDNGILDTAIHNMLGCGMDMTYRQCLQTKAGAYFADHQHKSGDSTGAPHYYESRTGVYVLYNRRDIAVMVCRGHATRDNAQGKYSSTYMCADVSDDRLWRLHDILDVDTPKLAQLITTAARKVYHIAPGQPLSTKLRVESIPLTDNIYFTGRGIAFNYGPNEIGTEDDAETSLFIPFSKLQSMLKPEFKIRMGLK